MLRIPWRRASFDRAAIVRLTEEIAAATHRVTTPSSRLAERITRLARKEARRAALASAADATADDLHAHRRAVRRLRFAREALGRPTVRLKMLQTALGRVIDDTLRLGWILRFPRQALVARLRVRVERRLARARRAHRAAVRGV